MLTAIWSTAMLESSVSRCEGGKTCQHAVVAASDRSARVYCRFKVQALTPFKLGTLIEDIQTDCWGVLECWSITAAPKHTLVRAPTAKSINKNNSTFCQGAGAALTSPPK